MVYIYNKSNLEFIDVLNYEVDEFIGREKSCYPEWNEEYMICSKSKLLNPIFKDDTIRDMTREEICNTGDLSVLFDGEYFEAGKIIKIEYNEELGYLRPTWNKDLHQWLDGATDLEKVQAQINEYSELDTPSTLKEMGTELANECMEMLIQLRNMAYTLGNPATIEDRDLPIFPKPSEKLKAFKEKFNSIKK
ncbi:hypothetical protein [Fusobacterium sp. SYSU M8A802]